MTIRSDLKPGQDYYLLNVSNYSKIQTTFGGAPEICFFKNDFKPFKIKVTLVEYDQD
jgi:hypothetical protein